MNVIKNGDIAITAAYDEVIIGGIKISGMTKREHFAAMAMQGLLSNPNIVTYSGTNDKSDRVRDMSVNYADGLLTALEQGQ